MQKFDKKRARVNSMLGMRRVVGSVASQLAEADSEFMFMTADVARYFGMEKFQSQYPDRIIDAGIAEQNMVGIAAGMAKEGKKIFAATYSTFITARSLDQVRVSMGYMGLNVKLIGVGGGLAEGDLSPTHMGLDDIGMIRAIPNIAIISPADGMALEKAMYELLAYNGPAYLRLTGRTNLPIVYKEEFEFKIGKANVLQTGDDIVLIANGCIVATALNVAKQLEKKGYSCTVVDMHTIRPLDTEVLDKMLDKKLIVTIEEHMMMGGLGSAVAEYYALRKNVPLHMIIGVGETYPKANEYECLLKKCNLTEEAITARILECMKGE